MSDPASWTLVAETDDFDIDDSIANATEEWGTVTGTIEDGGSGPYAGSNYYNFDYAYSMVDSGNDTISGTTTDSSNTYPLNEWSYTSATTGGAESPPGEVLAATWSVENSKSLAAEGTNSIGPGTDNQSTMSFDYEGLATETSEGEGSYATLEYIYNDGYGNVTNIANNVEDGRLFRDGKSRHLGRARGNPRTNRLDRPKLVGSNRETEQRPPPRPLLRRHPRTPARSRRPARRPPSGQPLRVPGAISDSCLQSHRACASRPPAVRDLPALMTPWICRPPSICSRPHPACESRRVRQAPSSRK